MHLANLPRLALRRLAKPFGEWWLSLFFLCFFQGSGWAVSGRWFSGCNGYNITLPSANMEPD